MYEHQIYIQIKYQHHINHHFESSQHQWVLETAHRNGCWCSWCSPFCRHSSSVTVSKFKIILQKLKITITKPLWETDLINKIAFELDHAGGLPHKYKEMELTNYICKPQVISPAVCILKLIPSNAILTMHFECKTQMMRVRNKKYYIPKTTLLPSKVANLCKV